MVVRDWFDWESQAPAQCMPTAGEPKWCVIRAMGALLVRKTGKESVKGDRGSISSGSAENH
jgi:hypothetical protein